MSCSLFLPAATMVVAAMRRDFGVGQQSTALHTHQKCAEFTPPLVGRRQLTEEILPIPGGGTDYTRSGSLVDGAATRYAALNL